MNRFKFHVRKMLGLSVSYYYPRAKVPASTHLPVLIALGKLFSVKNVVEFGSGMFSTMTFLNRAIFPHVERVLSFETDPEWKQRVEQMAKGDKRLELLLVGEEVYKEAAKCDFASFDLVFVDNGPTAEARMSTIKEVASRCHESNLVVIHDFENSPYQEAAAPLRERFCFDAYCPHTGVLWKGRRVDRATLSRFKQMNKGFAQLAKRIEPTDIEAFMRFVESGGYEKAADGGPGRVTP